MTKLTNPHTGHSVDPDDDSVDFWTTAGYVGGKPAAKKAAPAKKAAKKSSKK